jgi:GR25 family glycosyltransferase involved in LPS biosynthesis
MKIFVINLEARPDRLAFMSEQLKDVEWQRHSALNGHSLTMDAIVQLDFAPYSKWIDPLLDRKLTNTEIAAAISHYQLWEKCVELNEPILILEDDSQLVGDLDLKELELLSNEYDIVYLDHREMFPDLSVVGEKFVKPFYPYWNNAYVITPRLARYIINSPYRYNIIPVDELFPILSGIAFNDHCLGNKEIFISLQELLMTLPTNPVAYKESIFKQLPRKIMGSDIESGKSIMNTVHVLTVATDETKLKYLDTSAQKFGIKFINLGKDVVWDGGNMIGPGGGQKLKLVKNYVSQIPEQDIVLFVDGYDVFFNDDLQTIVDRFNGFDCKVLFAGEKNCWPDKSIAPLFGGDTDYKYLNSGVYIGYAGYVCSLIENYIQNSEDDQLYLQKKYIVDLFDSKKLYKIDVENYIFQCLAGAVDAVTVKSNGQLLNSETRCCPCILHGNGGDSVKKDFDRLFNTIFNESDIGIEFMTLSGYEIVGPEILEIDLLTPDMCKQLVNLADSHGKWEPMSGDKFPAQEIRIREININLFNKLEQHLKDKVYPLIEQYWFPLSMYGLRDAFIIKYTPETQAKLKCHHDASLVSGNVKLNSDYTGGDTYFYRQNYSNINTSVGKMTMWPGQVTHGHEGREVTSGAKYNLVIWTSRRPGDINY